MRLLKTIEKRSTPALLTWNLQQRHTHRINTSSEGRILYIAASSHPCHVTGCTIRTQELLQALHAACMPVFAIAVGSDPVHPYPMTHYQ
jgi:hypothetical protein